MEERVLKVDRTEEAEDGVDVSTKGAAQPEPLRPDPGQRSLEGRGMEGSDWPGHFFSCSLFISRLWSIYEVPGWPRGNGRNNGIYYALTRCQALFLMLLLCTDWFNSTRSLNECVHSSTRLD